MADERASSDPPEGSAKRFSVLLVDDDPSFLETMGAVLETEHDVATASSAFAAIRLLKTGEFHVVITDWLMPGMNGIDLVESILRLDRPLSVVFLTGRAEELAAHLEGEWRERLGVAIIAKPVKPSALLDRVRLLGRLSVMKSAVKKLPKKHAG